MSETSSSDPPSFETRHSNFFAEQFQVVRERAKLGGAFRSRLLEELEQALTAMNHPHVAFDPVRQLGKRSYDFTGIWRYKGLIHEWKHGIRIFYIGSEDQSKLVILEYGQRRQGAADDAYNVFGARLEQGYYDAYFRLLGLRHSYWKVPDPPEPVRR